MRDRNNLNALVLALALGATSSATWAQQPSTLGRNLAATCANCHGTQGLARGEMSPLAGLPAERIVTAMRDFRSGEMPATIMHQIARGYTEEQIRLIAEYLASLPAR